MLRLQLLQTARRLGVLPHALLELANLGGGGGEVGRERLRRLLQLRVALARRPQLFAAPLQPRMGMRQPQRGR